ncbi:uncharacterized protein LOC126892510 isoform X2 [Diabrotica virgifera virgifera]|uniref:Uncharacterized protein n=1 Tax=Diabrotica virgifera virgifera TaxID=50390 RepID=A0ABM5L6F9_DIAVI|nr:uncharacterized protein LOC126892510 isoform X2 [Diabrotica virgifera virgifera]
MHKLAIFGLFFLFSGLFGETVVPTATRGNENVTVQISRQSRASRDAAYRGLIVCAFRYDTGCFLDVAKQFLDSKRVELLAEADAEVARASGSTSTTNKPSQVAQTIEKLFTDLAGLFREGFANIFGVQENDDELAANKGKDTEENDDDEEDDDKKENTSRDIGVFSSQARKKKQEHPLKRLIRKILIGIVIISILNYILKFYFAGLSFLKWLVGFLYWKLHAIKLFLWWKKWKYGHGHEVHEIDHEPWTFEHGHGHDISHTIEHDSSLHGYDYSDHLFGAPETDHNNYQPYWGREDYAHNLAYSKQKPEKKMDPLTKITSMLG